MSRSRAAIPVLVAALGGAACSSTALPDAPSSAWSAGPMLPRPARDAGVAALGLSLVVAGGDTGAAITAEVDAFDTTTGTWGTLPDAPVRWVDLDLAAVGGVLYIAGGLEAPGGAAQGEAFALDPLDGVWRPIASLPPGEARGAAGVIGTPGRVYLLGGAASGQALDSCLAYDIATESWSLLPPLPAPRAHLAAMRRSDGWLIAGGGFAGADTSQPRGEVWGLPPLGTAWQLLAAMRPPGDPDLRGGCAYGVVLGQLTCAGGAAAQRALPTVDRYDPFVNAWTPGEPMPAARAGTQGAAIAGRLFVPGGSDASLAPTRTLFVYAPLDTAR